MLCGQSPHAPWAPGPCSRGAALPVEPLTQVKGGACCWGPSRTCHSWTSVLGGSSSSLVFMKAVTSVLIAAICPHGEARAPERGGRVPLAALPLAWCGHCPWVVHHPARMDIFLHTALDSCLTVSSRPQAWRVGWGTLRVFQSCSACGPRPLREPLVGPHWAEPSSPAS